MTGPLSRHGLPGEPPVRERHEIVAERIAQALLGVRHRGYAASAEIVGRGKEYTAIRVAWEDMAEPVLVFVTPADIENTDPGRAFLRRKQ